MKKRKLLNLVMAFSLSAIAVDQSIAQQVSQHYDVPQVISYQGVLASANGNRLPDGEYRISVGLYDDEQGTTRVWEDEYSVTVTGGVFNLALGFGKTPLPSSVTTDKPLWVGVRINGGEELKPFTPLTSVPYALNIADNAVTAKKMGTDYVGSISIEGKKITTKGSSLNLKGVNGISLKYDEATKSVILAPSSTGGKGKNPTWIGNIGTNNDGGTPIGTDPDNTIAGGQNNTTINPNNFSSILGGQFNQAPGGYASIGGGASNNAGGSFATIAGGSENATPADFSAVLGGHNNSAASMAATIGGGESNTINTDFASLLGGRGNTVAPGGFTASIGGGENNFADAVFGVIGGGTGNSVAGDLSTVSGGGSNSASGSAVTVSGGTGNNASASYSSIWGGGGNTIQAAADYSSAAGDGNTIASNGDHSTIAGGQALTVKDHTFGFNAGTTADITSMPSSAYFGNVNMLLGNTDGAARELRFYGPNVSTNYGAGAKYTAIKAGAQASNINYLLPTSQGSASTYLTNDGAGNLSWTSVLGKWNLTGNAGTISSNYLGTSDNMPFQIKVFAGSGSSTDGSGRVYYAQPKTSSPTITAGYQGNSILSTAEGSVIAGGGYNGGANNIDASYAFIGGGRGNSASGSSSVGQVVVGGESNNAGASYAAILGGQNNTAVGPSSTVVGGTGNAVQGITAAILGGVGNTISAPATSSAIWGGERNILVPAANYSAVFGTNNTVTSPSTIVFNHNPFPGGSPVVNPTLVGIRTSSPQHPLHSVLDDNTQNEKAAVYGNNVGSTTRNMGVWGDASNTALSNTTSIGVFGTGNGTRGGELTNVAIQANDGELTMGRSDYNPTNTALTVIGSAVELAPNRAAYSGNGPSGVVRFQMNVFPLSTPSKGVFQDLGKIIISNTYIKANSIIHATVVNKDHVLSSNQYSVEDAIFIIDVDDRVTGGGAGPGTCVLHLGMIPTKNLVSPQTGISTSDMISIGYTVINPSR